MLLAFLRQGEKIIITLDCPLNLLENQTNYECSGFCPYVTYIGMYMRQLLS